MFFGTAVLKGPGVGVKVVVKSDDWMHFGDRQAENNKQLLLDQK